MRTKFLVYSTSVFIELLTANAPGANANIDVIPFDPDQGDLLQVILQIKPDVLVVETMPPVFVFQNLFDDLQKLGMQIYYIFFQKTKQDKILYVMSEVSADKRLSAYRAFFETAVGKQYQCLHPSVQDLDWRDFFELDEKYYLRNERIAEILRGISAREFRSFREEYQLDLKNIGYYLFVFNLAPFEYADHGINKEIYYFIGHSLVNEMKNTLSLYNGGEVLYSSHNLIYIIINDFEQISLASKQEQMNDLVKKLCTVSNCKSSCLYLSARIDSIEDMRGAHEQYLKTKNLAFFSKDIRVLTEAFVRKTKINVDYAVIYGLLSQINDAIKYQNDVEGTKTLIIRLFLGYIKRSYNFSLYFYCYSSIIGMLDEALGITVSQVAVQGQSLSRFASIEQECTKLVNMLETLGRHRFSANTSTFVFDTITMIKQQYNEDLLISDIAKKLHVSGTYLSQMFKRKTGKSIIQYLIEYRIDQAKELLISTDDLISSIASKVGFHDACHFSKTFHKIVGATPKQYRKVRLKIS